MSGAWISSVLSNHNLGDRLGTRTKHFGRDWDPASQVVPTATLAHLDALRDYTRGITIPRESFPEADAVFDEKAFRRVGDLFCSAGFFVIRGHLAEILARFHLGEAGLLPFRVYRADLETLYPGEFFLLNFGSIKNTILPAQSQNVVKFAIDKDTGLQIWKVNSWLEDDEVTLSQASLEGPDLWFEELVDNKIFMSDALAQALIEIGMGDVFRLKRCRIAGGGA